MYMSPSGYRILFLALGVAVLIATFLVQRRLGPPTAEQARGSARIRTVVLVLMGLAGIALLVRAFLPELRGMATPAPQPLPVPAATSAPAAPAAVPVNLVALATQGVSECKLATAPAVPNGSTSTRAQMIAAAGAFKAYDAATNVYLKCVDDAIGAARNAAPNATADDQKELLIFGNSAHNTAVDQEQAAADQMNLQVRAFKAKHPGG
jgi:hypothetical protein